MVVPPKLISMELLDDAIASAGAKAYVAFGSSADADMRYLTRFRTTDPVPFVKVGGEPGKIIVSQMESERAARESTAVPVTRAQAGLTEILKEEKNRWRAYARMIAGLAGGAVLVPPQFPAALARELEALGRVFIDDDTVLRMRAVKSDEELAALARVQEATEAAMGGAIASIRAARVKKGVLYRGRNPLTSELLQAQVAMTLLERGCRAVDTIISCGEDSAIPHVRGAGPLREGASIILDIFPQDEETGYTADMSRTVVKGEPPEKIRAMFDAVLGAQTLAATLVRPGATGAEIHGKVVDYFRDRGFESNTTGFIHNLGHGVGLEVHELPVLGPGGGELAPGNVITLEPGLYYPGIGGVRLEDMGVVTPDGFRDLTAMPKVLRV
ncbi:MAG TPA: Xaa-Pro peptidase family protein [Methanomicrobiales archaeon]|nr:Xaa-Pro peptidase family protein [Methanomicrobiales archaeon]